MFPGPLLTGTQQAPRWAVGPGMLGTWPVLSGSPSWGCPEGDREVSWASPLPHSVCPSLHRPSPAAGGEQMAVERPELEELLGLVVASESQGTVVLEGRDSGNVRMRAWLAPDIQHRSASTKSSEGPITGQVLGLGGRGEQWGPCT